MAANHDIGSNYLLGLYTAGILFHDKDRIPRFSSRFNWTCFPHLPQVANHPIIICSSSEGLIACIDTVSNTYYIGNPSIHNSYIPLPETPSQHKPYNSNVVLVSNHALRRFYHLICVVHDSLTVYDFDVYCSLSGRWSSTRIDLKCYIIPNTGVSCGFFAYWLADTPAVIIFHNKCPDYMISRILLDTRILGLPGTLLQLGRVGVKLGLVTVEPSLNPRVILHLLEQGNLWQFQPYVSFNLPVPRLSIPLVMRFQSFKAELFFWVDGQLFLWEENAVGQRGHLQMVNKGDVHIGHGLAHVTTRLLPGDFNTTIPNTGGDDDDDH